MPGYPDRISANQGFEAGLAKRTLPLSITSDNQRSQWLIRSYLVGAR